MTVYTKLIITENGIESVPMTQAEINQWNADNTASQQRQAQEAMTAQALVDAKAAGITKAVSLGFTQAQAEAMFP